MKCFVMVPLFFAQVHSKSDRLWQHVLLIISHNCVNIFLCLPSSATTTTMTNKTNIGPNPHNDRHTTHEMVPNGWRQAMVEGTGSKQMSFGPQVSFYLFFQYVQLMIYLFVFRYICITTTASNMQMTTQHTNKRPKTCLWPLVCFFRSSFLISLLTNLYVDTTTMADGDVTRQRWPW